MKTQVDSGFKVISGIVMTTTEPNGDNNDKVICLASGSKSVGGKNLSKMGDVLNDGHAEILVRRCFKFFLYDEIENHLSNPNSSRSIFEEIRNPDCPDDLRLQVKKKHQIPPVRLFRSLW